MTRLSFEAGLRLRINRTEFVASQPLILRTVTTQHLLTADGFDEIVEHAETPVFFDGDRFVAAGIRGLVK